MNLIQGLGHIPPVWSVVEARRLLSLRKEPPGPSDQVVTAFRDGVVTKRTNRRTEGFTEAFKEIGYQHVVAGDLVVHSMDGFAGAIGVSDSDGKMSPVANIYRVHGDARFFAYVLRSLALSGFVASLAKGIRERSTSFDHATLATVQLPSPPLDEQRRIARFLDDQVARIDQIITARRRQVTLTLEAGTAETSNLLAAVAPDGPPLSAVCRIVDTEHKTAPTVPEGGYWIAGTGAIKAGRLVTERLRETDLESFIEWTARGAPVSGDVLLTREAPVGEVALLSDRDPEVAIGQRVVLLKPNHTLLDAGFLRLVLMAGEMRSIIALASAGSLHPHLNMSDISRLRIPDLRLDDQRSLAMVHEKMLETTSARASELERSVGLLSEYKESLITAAVAGEIDVTTANSGIRG